jgi:hypothetical protein
VAYRLSIALLAVSVAATPAPAQVQRLTLGDLVASAEYARRVADFANRQPAADVILVRNVARLTASTVLDRPLDVVVGSASRPGILGRAKERQRSYDFRLPADLSAVLDTIVMVVNGEMRAALRDRATGEEIARIRAPFDSLLDAQLVRSLDESAETLRRFEIMYGPGSVRLNALEAGLNYLVQWVPGFGVDRLAGPRPFELVAAYAPAYVTFTDGEARALSAAELGIRMYIFSPKWGGGRGVPAVLQPRHVAAGWAFTGPTDVTLQSPWRDRSRSGPFVSWGELKVAYITGRDSRVLLTRQLRFIPLVF